MARQLRHRVALVVDGKQIADGVLTDRDRALLNAFYVLRHRIEATPAGELMIRWKGATVDAARVGDWFPEAWFTEAA